MSSNIYAALEIGTTRTLLAIGESDVGGRLKVTSHASIPSSGVRKSQILDIAQVTQSIRAVLHQAEKDQSEKGNTITIGNAFLVISGQHIKAEAFTGTTAINGARVGDAEIEEVLQASRSLALPRDRELIDIVDQAYEVDSLGGVSTPKGMAGRILKLHALHIHADANRIRDAHTAADAAKLELRDPVFAATCAAEAVLEDHERRNGAIVIDFGGGSTGYAVYSDGYLATAGVIGVGGDHVTYDISNAFQTTQGQAEKIKISEASALLGGESDDNQRVKIPGSSPLMETRTISRRALDTVVNARMRELLGIIRDILEEQDLLHRLHAGVIITGGGAAMRDLAVLIQRELGMSVRMGLPINVDGLDQEKDPAAYATIAGALLYAHRNYEEKPLFGNFFRGLFK